MKGVDYSPAAVSARLREVARLSDLRPENRLAYKVDMAPAAISRRLRMVSDLRRDCLALVRLGEANGLGRARTSPEGDTKIAWG